MVRIRTANDIILSILDFYRTAQPQLDTKPGQVARDLLVDGPSTQLARLYSELASISSAQSLSSSLGSDLDALASNYGALRKQGSKSSGTALLTFNNIEADIPINTTGTVFASTGISFSVTNGLTVSVINKNTYRAIASKYRADLDFIGCEDQYAVEVSVQASVTGTVGNISKYVLNATSIPGVSRVTNATSFGGGSNSEQDASYKRRILGIFSGSNTGTATGYRDAVAADPEVLDVLVVGPGDTLMTRDGTIVNVAEDGTRTIISEGSGGKVDIYAFGFRLTQIIDSFIYHDKSNKNNPTNSINDFVLGQITADAGKSVTRKRIDDIQNNELPNQPVNNIISVSGSVSGSNFKAKQTDSLGVITGNYELIRDTGAYAGSPWGFDKIHWIDNKIRNFSEDATKGKYNSIDPVGFSDVSEISEATQNINIVNENSKVNSSDRSSIQLSHMPITSVSRVFNLTTGERYIIKNQNPDGYTGLNQTGRIIVSGNTLPSVSDILQVDYVWNFNYDADFDFDNKVTSSNPRTILDSIDWGYSNAIRREEVIITSYGSQKVAQVSLPISSVININSFSQDSGTITLINNRFAIPVTSAVENVISVVRTSDGAELYKTGKNNGSFSGFTVFLPTDTSGKISDSVSVRYNAIDNFNLETITGSYNENIITLPSSASISVGTIVECNYISDVKQILPATNLSILPAIRNRNEFQTNSITNFGTQPTTHIYESTIELTYSPPILKNIRIAPTRLKLSIAGTISPGVITIKGTSFTNIIDGVFIATNTGLKQDLTPLIRKSLGLSSNQTIPSNISIVKLVKFEKVEATTNLDVLSIDNSYDVIGYGIKDNSFVKSESIKNTSLTSSEIQLPSTTSNITYLPNIGDKFMVTFHISKTDDAENVSFSKSGTLYTQKIFSFVDSISISSGFISTSSQSATLTIVPHNQPIQGSRYTIKYDYLAPKVNERITINYNKNAVITDNTFEIERTRPIGADVLVKAATPILVDANIAVVVAPGYENSSSIIQQNVKDTITSALNSSSLGSTIDESDLINAAYSVTGVDRVRSTHFNIANTVGRVLSIVAQKNQYIQANTVTITIENR